MTASNAAEIENVAQKPSAEKVHSEKVHEKLAEKRRALGRGLESLLPGPRVVPAALSSPQSARKDGAPEPTPAGASLDAASSVVTELQAAAAVPAPGGEHPFELALDHIQENPYQTRREFDQESLQELASSIQVQGVLQPIAVRPGKDGRFILILGERRFRASKMAGKATIPAIIKRVSEQQAAEMTLVENLQRRDLNCVEQAEAFANLSKVFNLTQEEIGKRAGVSREQVSNYMRLLALPEGVIGALQQGRLTYSHARTLLQLRDDIQIWKYAQKAMDEKLSVAKLEELVLGVSAPIGSGTTNKAGGARWVDPNVKAAQRSLEEVLGMRVRIRDRKGRGKILIEYATIDDFDRVVRMLRGK
ncbi:MAG: ParB/RepB/Spo0J family partition protein [Terriglobales bacterium]